MSVSQAGREALAVPRSGRGAWCLVGAALVGLLLPACDRAAPTGRQVVPEPTEPLRSPQGRGPVPASAHIIDYEIRARLATEARRIDGRERIVWRNTSNRAIDTIPFHLYMNGFRAENTAWMRDARGTHRGVTQAEEHPWGYCEVSRVSQVRTAGADGGERAEALAWVERSEPSLADVKLTEPVPPGGEVVLDIEFTTKLPRVFARTGFADDFYMVGQWFPKVGVLDRRGSWHAHPFTLNSEFYADFGDYEVALDVPADFVVGATGIRVGESTEGERSVLTYRAAMVHDFAWTASPELIATDTDYEGIRVRALVSPPFTDQASDHLEVQLGALRSLEARLGAYPWSTLTLVLPPDSARGAMGMEYPTLFTTNSIMRLPWLLDVLGYQERVSGRFTTIHEFGHQYFQGLLASDEFTQPWLDEGMNSFINTLVAEDVWGPDPWIARLAGNPLSLADGLRLQLAAADAGTQIVDAPADAFDPALDQYGVVVYAHTSAVMSTLRNLVGPEAFDRALRVYADRFRFGHPTGADLEAVLRETLGNRVRLAFADEEVAGSGDVFVDVGELLDQGLRSTASIDFAVSRVANVPIIGSAGYHRDEDGALVGGEPRAGEPLDERPDKAMEGVVVVQRRGEFRVPVEIEVVFSDDATLRLWWDGQADAKILRFSGQRVDRVRLDPERLLALETKRANNGRTAPGKPAPPGPAEGLGQLAEAAALAALTGLGP